jgi:hypothetical protein
MWRTDELIPWMATVDRKLISAATLATAVLFLIPIVLTLMGYISWK